MDSRLIHQSVWKRAWEDTEHFRKSTKFFLGVEVLGSAALAALTASLTFQSLHRGQVFSITFLVFVFGFVIMYGLIYIWNLLRAPYCQRNEARSEVEILNQKLDEIAEKAKPKLKVEKIELRPLKWVLKVINESEDTAENCIGVLEMVEDAEPSAHPSSDMYGSRRLMWEDINSIPSQGSALLCVIDIHLSTSKDGRPDATPAYEKPDTYPLALNHHLILLISLRSEGCRPLYTICYCYRDNLKTVHQLKLIEANLEKRPTVDECRKILTEHIGRKGN